MVVKDTQVSLDFDEIQRLKRSGGIPPVNWLSASKRLSRSARSPNEAGIVVVFQAERIAALSSCRARPGPCRSADLR